MIVPPANELAASLRRWPHVLGILSNAVFCTLIGLALSGYSGWEGTAENLIVSYSIGGCIYIAISLLARALSPRLPIQVITTAGMAIGLVLGLALGGRLAFGAVGFFFTNTGGLWIGLLFGVFGAVFFGALGMMLDVRARLAAVEVERLAQKAELAEAGLRVLQAQVEPHFLFNTLSNVHSLIPVAPDRAAQMLERLTLLLRTSLARARTPHSTVAQEIEIVRAWLDIAAMRMPDRIRTAVHVDPDLATALLPPLLLQPLVENAITHGAEPRAEPTMVEVSIQRSGDDLVLTVRDDGAGIGAGGSGRGHGSALANIRARLHSLFGERASLSLAERSPSGMLAQVRLPLRREGENPP